MFDIFNRTKNLQEVTEFIEKTSKRLSNYRGIQSDFTDVKDFIVKYFKHPIVQTFLLDRYLPNLLKAKLFSEINILLLSLKEDNQTAFIKKYIIPNLIKRINSIENLNCFVKSLKDIGLFEFDFLKHTQDEVRQIYIANFDKLLKFEVELVILLLIESLYELEEQQLLSIDYFCKDHSYFYVKNKELKAFLEQPNKINDLINSIKGGSKTHFTTFIVDNENYHDRFFKMLPELFEKIEDYQLNFIKEKCYLSLFLKEIYKLLSIKTFTISKYYLNSLSQLLKEKVREREKESFIFMPKKYIMDRIKKSYYSDNLLLSNRSFEEFVENNSFLPDIPDGFFELDSFSKYDGLSLVKVLFGLGLLNLLNFERSLNFFMKDDYLIQLLQENGISLACYLALFGDENVKAKILKILKNISEGHYSIAILKKNEDYLLLKFFAELMEYEKITDFPLKQFSQPNTHFSKMGLAIFLNDYIKDQDDLLKLYYDCRSSYENFFLSYRDLIILEKFMWNKKTIELAEIQDRIFTLILNGNIAFLKKFFSPFNLKTTYIYKKTFKNQNIILKDPNMESLLEIPSKIFFRLLFNLIEIKDLNSIIAFIFSLKINNKLNQEEVLDLVFGMKQHYMENLNDYFYKEKVLLMLNTLFLTNKVEDNVYCFCHSKLTEKENIISPTFRNIFEHEFLNKDILLVELIQHSVHSTKLETWFEYNSDISAFFKDLKKSSKLYKNLNEKEFEVFNNYLQDLFYHCNFMLNFN